MLLFYGKLLLLFSFTTKQSKLFFVVVSKCYISVLFVGMFTFYLERELQNNVCELYHASCILNKKVSAEFLFLKKPKAGK